MTKEFNGHRSWNAWNVFLWISNDEHIYNFAMECINKPSPQGKKPTIGQSVEKFLKVYGGEKTPDGGRYNPSTVKAAFELLTDRVS